MQILKTRADIERCWIKYCVNLLGDSVKEARDSDITEKVNKITEMKNAFEEKEEGESRKRERGRDIKTPCSEHLTVQTLHLQTYY